MARVSGSGGVQFVAVLMQAHDGAEVDHVRQSTHSASQANHRSQRRRGPKGTGRGRADLRDPTRQQRKSSGALAPAEGDSAG